MYPWPVNTSIIYYHQFFTNGSHFALIHNYNTGKLFKPLLRTNLYGQNSITISAVNAWNKIQPTFGNVILKNLTTTQINTILTKRCIEKY